MPPESVHLRVSIIIASDSRSQAKTTDLTTQALATVLTDAGCTIVGTSVVADDTQELVQQITSDVDDHGANVVLTSGGTGLGPRDVTPDATRLVVDREVPGIAEMLRCESSKITRKAWLSRATAGIRGSSLVVNLPGSPQGAVECAQMLLDVLPHAVNVMGGMSHDAVQEPMA